MRIGARRRCELYESSVTPSARVRVLALDIAALAATGQVVALERIGEAAQEQIREIDAWRQRLREDLYDTAGL
jgi:hypothetical protein